MRRGRSFGSLPSALSLGALGLALIFTQSGCPGGAELENPGAWAGRFGAAASGTGGGSGGTGMTGPILDFSTVQCTNTTPETVLKNKCATSFCHGTSYVADLDLRPDSGFAARVKDVPATFGDILRSGSTEEYIPDSCPTGASIVDSDAAASSWMLLKLGMQGDCGVAMPSGKTLSADELACLTQIVNAVAALK